MKLNQPTYDFIGLTDIPSGADCMVDDRAGVVFGVRRPDDPPAGDDVT